MIEITKDLKDLLDSAEEPNVGGLAGMPTFNWQIVEIPIKTTVCPTWANFIHGDKAISLYIESIAGYFIVKDDIKEKLKSDYGWEGKLKLGWTNGDRVFRGQSPFAYANVLQEWLPK